MLNIEKAEYVNEYKIHLSFNNGRNGIANFEEVIFNDKRAIFSCLRDKAAFKDFNLAHGTIVWLNEIDLAPEYLFYLAFMNDSELQEQFKKWGYIVKSNIEAEAA